ncbi:sensor histidine kinase [Paenibacillus eucommiae]|uniref:histidine kinase n=1 Tax=Paenibacillus eucommiae TaxID=1355755 RepID=A0ABS4J722_9BACL|nr:response regulator [Paenibacillus eucommiae]MBP1995644.1 light-regulated signal transduction histidine kinase (bacteriophytochrome) [Paenibacillus eucommiae]
MKSVRNWTYTGAKILVVDDRKENLYAMEKILHILDCEIFKAYSGNEALSFTLRHDFALILLDVNMPEMDGFELAELLRSNEETSRIPIIFVTAINKEDNSVFKGYESGAVDYLFKPVDEDILLSKVKIFLELNLKQKELEAMKTELERSNQSLTEFTSVVAHDLKNPLGAIMGLCDMVIAKYSDGMENKGKQCMQHISGTARRMNSLITDVLAYAQVNAETTSFTAVDLNVVIKDVIEDLNSRIEIEGGKVELIGQLPVVEADRTQMYQLFQNLIGNGMKYHHKERAPHVKIYEHEQQHQQHEHQYRNQHENQHENQYGQQHQVRQNQQVKSVRLIIIEDNGIGMKQDDIPDIFTPFKRLDNAKGYEGTGLGLATVHKIIEQHHGAIEVSSDLGEGTTFRLSLQVKQTS